MVHLRHLALPLAFAFIGTSCGVITDDDTATVHVYTGRHYDLEPAFEEFTEETGIDVEFLTGTDAELRERLETEGDSTEADIFMTVDAANLSLAAQEDIFQPLNSTAIEDAIPAQYQAADGTWTGLSLRARTLVYNPDNVDETNIPSTYAELAEPQWEGRVCLRQSTSTYTQSLVASIIAHEGRAAALETVGGWTNNAEILSNDIQILEALEQGQCDVGITNHYYLARKLEEDPEFGVKLVWADQDGFGTHINISGAGITKNADNPDGARQLLEFLATDGQSIFVDGNHEFPANDSVAPIELVEKSFGSDFKQDDLDAEEFGDLNAEALDVMDEVGYR